jgi:hypothetical protein
MLIKDLTKELAAADMTAVQGGAFDRGNSNVSTIGQAVVLNAPNIVATGPGSSLTNSNNIDVSNYATQDVHQNNGDAFIALFPYYGPVRI